MVRPPPSFYISLQHTHTHTYIYIFTLSLYHFASAKLISGYSFSAPSYIFLFYLWISFLPLLYLIRIYLTPSNYFHGGKQELKAADDELTVAKTEVTTLQRAVEVVNKKLRQSEERRVEVCGSQEKGGQHVCVLRVKEIILPHRDGRPGYVYLANRFLLFWFGFWRNKMEWLIYSFHWCTGSSGVQAETKQSMLKNEINSLQRDLDATRKTVESDRKQLEDLTRARDVMQRKMLQVWKKKKRDDWGRKLGI